MPKFNKMIYSPSLFDAMFALAGAGGAALLAFGSAIPHPPQVPIDRPVWMGLVLVAVIFASAVLASFTTRIDQKCADDFVFMTLTKSAFIALVTVIFVVVFWELLFSSEMGDLPGAATIPMVMVAWSFGYFYTRIRGTGA